jgi:hypothetical protein
VVDWSGWKLDHNGQSIDCPEDFLPDWDRASTLVLRYSFGLDRMIAAGILQLDPAVADLQFVVQIGTGPGRQFPRRILQRIRHPLIGQGGDVEHEVALDSTMMSGNLFMEAFVVLARDLASGSRLAPSKAGSRLWESRTRLRLEGQEARFPIEVQDFRLMDSSPLLPRAPWMVKVNTTSWDRDFLGAARLLLNTAREDVIEAVKRSDPLLLQAILGDVLVQICTAYLVDHGVEDPVADSPDGSIGYMAHHWLACAWPGKDLAYIRARMETAPSEFRAALLSLAEI